MASDESVRTDVAVIGGGMAGICAALSAARLGCETVLVNDRPVLGGNASSEVRVWVNGATGGNHNRYAREGGIMEELLLNNKYQNPGGSADLWDAILQDTVAQQSNLSLYLNTLVTDIETEGDRVTAAVGHQNMTERTFRFESPLFVDATGDGIIADRAGAEWIQGREAAEEYGEAAAPPEADEKTLGSSIMFYSKEVDHDVAYEPPSFARDFREHPPEIVAKRTDPDQRIGCYWWIEHGGTEALDPIADSDEIRDELRAVVYGVWDYIKNSEAFPAEEVSNLQLEWVGKIPGKRESRRVIGEHVVTEDDVVSQRRFADAIGHGGWSIDLHPPSGIYDDQGQGSQHYHIDGPYSFPYRSLYARDLENVFLAGRHMSATHIAFGTLRVQMTLAVAGQAIGTAAALCDRRNETPTELAVDGVDALQQTLLRDDQWIIGVANHDPTDRARDATVTASSTHPSAVTNPDTTVDLNGNRDMGFHFAYDGYLGAIELLLEGIEAVEDDGVIDLAVDVYTEARPENTVPGEHHRSVQVSVPISSPEWIELPIDLDIGDPQGVFVVLREPDGVRIHARDHELTGIMALPRNEWSGGHEGLPADDEYWGVSGKHATTPTSWIPCVAFDSAPATPLFGPENLTDGYSRPFGLGHSWVSEPFDAVDRVPDHEDERGITATEPEWVELAWDTPQEITTVQLVTNTRLTEWYNIYGEESRTVPETIRSYRIEVEHDEEWEPVATETKNYRRFRRHTFDPVRTRRLRIVVEATNGVPRAELFEIRAYGPNHDLPLEDV